MKASFVNDKAFVQFVVEVRAACDRYLKSQGIPLTPDVSLTRAEPDAKAGRTRKPKVKGNPRCRCGHGYTVHDEPRDNTSGNPENICRGCEADGSKLGCPEFIKKGTMPADASAGDQKAANGAHESVEFSSMHVAILAALAVKPNKTAQQVSILTVYVQSGTFNSAIADLRDLGFIEGSPLLQLTSYGMSKATDIGRKYDSKSLRASWSQKLGTLGAKIIEVLHEHVAISSSADLATFCNYVQSGTFNSMVAKMRRMGLITKKLPLALCKELS